MGKEIKIGDFVIHKFHGAIGRVVMIDTPSDSVEYAFVKTGSGNTLHEPISEWARVNG